MYLYLCSHDAAEVARRLDELQARRALVRPPPHTPCCSLLSAPPRSRSPPRSPLDLDARQVTPDQQHLLVRVGIEIGIERDIVSVSGIDKQLVGEFAAKIRLAQNPEPYNGKGVRYFGEQIIKKQGKAFGA